MRPKLFCQENEPSLKVMKNVPFERVPTMRESLNSTSTQASGSCSREWCLRRALVAEFCFITLNTAQVNKIMTHIIA